MELRSIEEHISQLHNEIEKMKPQIEEEKKTDFEASLQYLRRLAKANKDTKKFLRMMVNNSLDEYLDKMNPYGYQPFTIEELIYEHFEAHYLFDSVDHFFDWAHRSLKKSSGSTKHSI